MVYDDAYGGKKVGRIEDNKLYDSYQGGKVVGEYEKESGRVFDDSHRPIGQTDNKDGAGYFILDGE